MDSIAAFCSGYNDCTSNFSVFDTADTARDRSILGFCTTDTARIASISAVSSTVLLMLRVRSPSILGLWFV